MDWRGTRQSSHQLRQLEQQSAAGVYRATPKLLLHCRRLLSAASFSSACRGVADIVSPRLPALGRPNRSKNYGSWRHLQPATPEMMLVASSSNRIAIKMTIENQTVTNQDAKPNEIRSVSVPHITDFFEARHQLMLQYREIDNIQEATAPRVNDNRRHKSSPALAKSVEAALYWGVSAPTLLYLFYLVVRPLIDIKP